MAAPGRPTPQPERDGWPRFDDRLPEDYRRSDVNPFVRSHREFGLPLLPASEAWPWRGRWEEHFGRVAPLHVEIGSGNGFFLTALAAARPEWDLLGIEIRYKRTVLCAKKLVEAGVTNARIVRYHAGYLDDLFTDRSVSGLYVNHPDPWPKERHDKHRLMSPWFMEEVARLLRPGAYLRLKSDFRGNVDRTAELVATLGLPLAVSATAEDVNAAPAPWPDDFETNYQRKFKARGLPVHAIEVVRLG